MRRRHTLNYWVTLFYNGVIFAIWPTAALAFVLRAVYPGSGAFLISFLIGMCLLIPVGMWLFHAVIWPRRKLHRSQK